MRASDVIIRTLEDEGVEYIFGNPGSTELLFLESLLKSKIKYIISLHENVAMGMAEGYARASGKIGVLNLHTVPGVANALSLLYNAWDGYVPILILAGQQDTRLLSKRPWIGGDILRLSEPFIKWGYELKSPEETFYLVKKAIREALSPPEGPVILSLPQNLLHEEAPCFESEPARISPAKPADEDIEKAAELINSSENPIIITGDEVSRRRAVKELLSLAEKIGSPVYEPWMGEVNFPNHHDLYMGAINIDSDDIKRLLKDKDLLISIGCLLYTSPSPRD